MVVSSSSESSTTSIASETADKQPKDEKLRKQRVPARTELFHINPSSWQPVLLFALVEECKELQKSAIQNNFPSPEIAITDYLLSDRGWRLLEVLSQTHWKDIAVPGLDKADLLNFLSSLYLSVDWYRSEKDVNFAEWDHLLVPESKLLEAKAAKKTMLPLGPQSSGPDKPTKKPPKKPKYYDWVDNWEYRESAERELQMEEEQRSSSDVSFDIEQETKATGQAQAPPYILQEDSDGFPLCWNEDAPLPGFEGGKPWLDDMILDMLHLQLELKIETRSEVGVAVMLLALMKKTVGCFMSSPYFTEETDRQQFLMGTVDFINRALTWIPQTPSLLHGDEENYDWKEASGFLRSLLLSRHCSRDMARAAFDGAMEFLLESGHRLAVGLPCIVDACLQLFADHQLADHLQVAGQILGIFYEAEFLESLRDLAMATDLLAQVNFRPPRSRMYSESGGSGGGGVMRYMDNAYQSRLYCLLLSIASLSSRLQEAKTLWLHCSVCKRTNHSRCSLEQTPMVGHHHGILEFPETSTTPGFVPLENRSREAISARCASAFLIRVLFECLKNVRGVESKEMAYLALQCSGNCCCISPEVLLANLLSDLRELSDTSQRHLLKSLKTHLHPHVQLCRMCDRDELSSLDATSAGIGGYVAALEGFFKTSDEAVLIRLCRLVWSILPSLTKVSRELICAQAVVPCLIKLCVRVLRKDPPNLLGGMRKFEKHPEDAHRMDGSKGIYYFTFVYEKFLMAFKLCDNDLSNLIGESASQFWLVVSHVLELSRTLLTRSSGFETIFARYEGRLRCLQLISSCLTQMTQGSGSGEDHWADSKSAQRLTSLLGQVLSLALLNPSKYGAKDELLERLSKVFFEYGGRKDESVSSRTSSTSSEFSGRPYLAYRLCGMLIDCAMGVPVSREDIRTSANGRRKCQKSRSTTQASDSDTSVDSHSAPVGESESGYTSDDLMEDDGYEGDIEVGSFDTPPERVSLTLQHPELCKLALKYLLLCLERLEPQTARDFVAMSAVQKLTLICFKNKQNLSLLRDQGILDTIHKLAQEFAQRSGDAAVLKSILDLLCLFMQEKPQSDDLEKIVKMLRIKNAPDDMIIDTLIKLLIESPLEPNSSLVFPQVSTVTQKQNFLGGTGIGVWKSVLAIPKHKPLSPKKALAKRAMTMKPGMYGRSESAPGNGIGEREVEKGSSAFLSGLASFFGSGNKSGGRVSQEGPPAMSESLQNGRPSPTKPPLSRQSSLNYLTPSAKMTPSPFATLPKSQKKKQSMGFGKGGSPAVSPAGDLAPDAAVVLTTEGVGSTGGASLSIEEGVTVSLWLKVDKSMSKGTNPHDSGPYGSWWHVVSFGSEDLLISVYEHPEQDQTALRIMNRDVVVQERRYKKLLFQQKWVHLAISFVLEGRELLKIQMYANGLARHSWDLSWNCEELRFYLPCFLGGGCLTEVQKSTDMRMKLGSVLAFRGTITHEKAVLLCGFGPRCSTLADSKTRTMASSVYPLLRPALLCQELNTLTLLEDQEGILESLQKTQVLCYSPSDPRQFGVYLMPLQQQMSSLDSGIGESHLSLVRLRQFPVEGRCALDCEEIDTMDDAFANLGGARLLLIIFAAVVDKGSDERTQAKALRLLLSGVQRHPEWWRTFSAMLGYSMVAKVLAAENCIKGDMLLHEICCASMSGVPESSDELGGALEEGTLLPIVQNPDILSALLGNPDIWKSSRVVWENGLSILARALDEENLYASFNATQLNRAGFLKKLLLVCLEVAQESNLEQPSPAVAVFLVPVIQGMLGSPPELSHLTALWDFLFLSHPAACTYLNYRISGHSDWVNLEWLSEEPINLVRYESPLSRKLRQYYIVLGQDRLSTIMAESNGSISAARREFEVAAGDQPSYSYGVGAGAKEEFAAGEKEQKVQSEEAAEGEGRVGGFEQEPRKDSVSRLPDLVCDIDPNSQQTGTTTGSDSGGEWSQDEASLVTTEEYATAGESDDRLASRDQGEHHWVVETRAGLLEVLSVVLLTGPDTLVGRLVGSIVKWEPLIVMLNHQPNSKIRGTCVKALCALLLRSPDPYRLKFMKSNGFSLLANQLREYQCTTPIADSLFSVLCGEPLRLEEGLDASHLYMMSVNRFQCGVLEPILALFENCCLDTTLFWNVASNIQKIFENNSVLAQALLDNHLAEALVNVLITLSKLDLNSYLHVFQIEFKDGLLAWADLVNYQACVELLTLLFQADWQAYKDGTTQQQGVIRRQLCSLLQISLENIRTLYSDDGISASNMVSMESVATGAFAGSKTASRKTTPNVSGRSSPVHSEISSTSSFGTQSFLTAPTPSPQQSSGLLGGSFSNLKQKLMNLSSSGSQLNAVGRSRNERQKIATHSELVERLKLCLQYCADLFLHLPPGDAPSDEEEHLFEFYVYFLVSTAKDSQKDSRRLRKNAGTKTWHRLIYACRDRVRLLLAHLMAFVLFPAAAKLTDLDRKGSSINTVTLVWSTSRNLWMTPKRRWPVEENDEEAESGERKSVSDWVSRRQLFVARALAHEVQYKQMLKGLLDINLDYQFAMNISLHELLLLDKEYQMSKHERGDVEKLLRFLKHLKINSPLEKLSQNRLHCLSTDEQLCLQTYQELRQSCLQRLKQSLSRLKMKQSNAAEPVSQTAMSVTCSVVEDQNVPRKLFIQHSKASFAENIQADEQWRSLVADLCHPCGSCHDPNSWPPSWGLDPTEGPNRERRRLVACHLGISEEFLVPSERWKLEAETRDPPLTSLLNKLPVNQSPGSGAVDTGGWDATDLAGQLIDRLRIDEKIAFSTPATILRSTFECTGEILLGDQRIYFVGESSKTAQKGLPQKELISMSWTYTEVVEVYKRYHELLDRALEVFFNDGETYLISFDSVEKRNFCLHRLLTMDLPNLTTYSDNLSQALTQWWREGNITNFEYLMQLNKLAGRTFSDLMQYPVFPFILADYSSFTLDLTSPIVFRDLAKPIAIQDRKMEDHYMKVYKLEIEARRAPAAASKSIPHFGPYHYGSHYSNSGIVVHYLVRVPPFTRMALEYQDNNFDIPDRLFASLETIWRLASNESTTDFKELIPEFYFWPEFLTNFEGLNLGKRQTGAIVGDVELPPWVPNGDPRLFILIHRAALESPYVSAHLNMWVDLVFGYKQSGQAAVEAINVFHPATYHGTQLAAETTDELHRNALKAMVRTYGQMPKQLFRVPHQPHLHVKPVHLSQQKYSKSPLESVHGIRWGIYVGSPDAGEPVLVLKQKSTASSADLKPTQLKVVSEGTCLGLPSSCDLLVRWRAARQGEVSPWSGKEVDSLAVVFWAFSDGVVRGRLLSPEPGGPWVSMIALHDQKVCSSAYSISNGRLFLGLKSGILRVYKLEHYNLMIKSCVLEKELYGHKGSVLCVFVCPEFSIVVSGCSSGQVLMWDLNRLIFVRSLTKHGGLVSHCAVSKTSCDIATVCQIGYGSQILLHAVNGRLIGYVDTDIAVCSIALSNLAEGTGVNCIAAGLQNGIIRLWNVWTLAPMRDIMHTSFFEPIISLAYAQRSKKLYACTKSGTVLCWEATSSKQSKAPRYVFANPRL